MPDSPSHDRLSPMRKKYLLVIVMFIIIGAQDAQTILPEQGELYAPMTFPVDVDPAIYDNPFDPDDVEVLGIFQSPGGGERVVAGFWMQPYDAEFGGPEGSPVWQVRFTPQQVGDWTVALQVWDDGLLVDSEDAEFTVVPSGRLGFIGTGENGRYFRFSDGQPFFPIGHNLKWSWDGGGDIWVYERWLDDLSANGGNYARLVIDVPWFINLEWEGPVGDYRTAQASAAKLDALIDMAGSLVCR